MRAICFPANELGANAAAPATEAAKMAAVHFMIDVLWVDCCSREAAARVVEFSGEARSTPRRA